MKPFHVMTTGPRGAPLPPAMLARASSILVRRGKPGREAAGPLMAIDGS